MSVSDSVAWATCATVSGIVIAVPAGRLSSCDSPAQSARNAPRRALPRWIIASDSKVSPGEVVISWLTGMRSRSPGLSGRGRVSLFSVTMNMALLRSP
jgi:hypothetical protein